MSEIVNFSRNSQGLFENISYFYKPNGLVDWRKMFLKEHLYVNPKFTKKVEEEFGKPVLELDVSDIPDKYLISTLPGTRYLAWLRGYSKSSIHIHRADSDYASCECTIKFTPNFEFPDGAEFTSLASASPLTTNKFGQKYLVELAENRAFVRCVRNFLNINIVSREELTPDGDGQIVDDESQLSGVSTDPMEAVKNKLKSLGFQNYGAIKIFLNSKDAGAKFNNFSQLSDLSKLEAIELLGLVQTLKQNG